MSSAFKIRKECVYVKARFFLLLRGTISKISSSVYKECVSLNFA